VLVSIKKRIFITQKTVVREKYKDGRLKAARPIGINSFIPYLLLFCG